jgi:hypothetical protein
MLIQDVNCLSTDNMELFPRWQNRVWSSAGSQFLPFPTAYKTCQAFYPRGNMSTLCNVKGSAASSWPRLAICEALLSLGSSTHVRVWHRNNFKRATYLTWKTTQPTDWLSLHFYSPIILSLLDATILENL